MIETLVNIMLSLACLTVIIGLIFLIIMLLKFIYDFVVEFIYDIKDDIGGNDEF